MATPVAAGARIGHVHLKVADLDRAIAFYSGVLGMPLVATLIAGPMRHYFFEMAPGNTIAFFEVEGMETFAKGAGSPSDRVIQLDHISFNVPDEHALELLRKQMSDMQAQIEKLASKG